MPRASAGASRGALMLKSTLLMPVTDFFLDFAFPKASQERSWAPSRRSLGTPGRSWDIPGGPQGRPGAFLGSHLGDFGTLLGDLLPPEGPQDGPRTEFGATLD